MKISIFTILALVTAILWIKHIWTKPDLLNGSENLAILWFQQLWVFQIIFVILVVADVFYMLIKDKQCL